MKRGYERKDRVNLENRARRYATRIDTGRTPMGIREKDIDKYCKTSNKFCRIDEVKFINLELEKYIRHHVDISNSKEFEPGKPAFL